MLVIAVSKGEQPVKANEDNILGYDSYKYVWDLSSFNGYVEEYSDLIHQGLYPESEFTGE
jgi:hypothetical protein